MDRIRGAKGVGGASRMEGPSKGKGAETSRSQISESETVKSSDVIVQTLGNIGRQIERWKGTYSSSFLSMHKVTLGGKPLPLNLQNPRG